MYFGEIMTAMVTPFDANLELDLHKVDKLVEHLINTHTDTIVVAGTTGESPTLTHEEKLALLKRVYEVSRGRAKIIMNVGNNNTKESANFAREVEASGYADGIMLVNPYYNKPSQEGLYHHFATVAQGTNLPVLLYNIPGRTGVNLNAKTTIELSKIPNIFGVKEASGDLSQMAHIIENTHDDFLVYSGDDGLTLPLLSLGGAGIVSVAAHVVGNEMHEMIQAYKGGAVKEAANLHRKLLPFFEGIFFQTNPVPIKKALNLLDIPVGSVRLPLVDMKEDGVEVVKNMLSDLNIKVN